MATSHRPSIRGSRSSTNTVTSIAWQSSPTIPIEPIDASIEGVEIADGAQEWSQDLNEALSKGVMNTFQTCGIPMKGFALISVDHGEKVAFWLSSNTPTKGRKATFPLGFKKHIALSLKRALGCQSTSDSRYKIPFDDNGVVEDSYYNGCFGNQSGSEARLRDPAGMATTNGSAEYFSPNLCLHSKPNDMRQKTAESFCSELRRGSIITVQLDETWKLKLFYGLCFDSLTQLVLKTIEKTWVKEMQLKKQTHFPYSDWNPDRQKTARKARVEGPPRVPDWFPLDICRHREPDHITKEERMELAVFLLCYRDPEISELARAFDEKSNLWTDFLKRATDRSNLNHEFDKEALLTEEEVQNRRLILESIYFVARLEEQYWRGERDGRQTVDLHLPVSASARKNSSDGKGHSGEDAVDRALVTSVPGSPHGSSLSSRMDAAYDQDEEMVIDSKPSVDTKSVRKVKTESASPPSLKTTKRRAQRPRTSRSGEKGVKKSQQRGRESACTIPISAARVPDSFCALNAYPPSPVDSLTSASTSTGGATWSDSYNTPALGGSFIKVDRATAVRDFSHLQQDYNPYSQNMLQLNKSLSSHAPSSLLGPATMPPRLDAAHATLMGMPPSMVHTTTPYTRTFNLPIGHATGGTMDSSLKVEAHDDPLGIDMPDYDPGFMPGYTWSHEYES